MDDDFTMQYNTQLSPDEEIRFQRWAESAGRIADLRDYDLRGAWRSGAGEAANGHFPDTFKKPNHPTFSDESQYSTPEAEGGKWRDGGDGKWVFWASPHNVRGFGVDALQGYFRDNEPDAALIFPQESMDPKGELDRLFTPQRHLDTRTNLGYLDTR